MDTTLCFFAHKVVILLHLSRSLAVVIKRCDYYSIQYNAHYHTCMNKYLSTNLVYIGLYNCIWLELMSYTLVIVEAPIWQNIIWSFYKIALGSLYNCIFFICSFSNISNNFIKLFLVKPNIFKYIIYLMIYFPFSVNSFNLFDYPEDASTESRENSESNLIKVTSWNLLTSERIKTNEHRILYKISS